MTTLSTAARPAAERPAERWLPLLTDYVLEHGLDNVTLRGLAGVAGTSHRMLSYYFGSLDTLLGAVADELRRRRVAALTATTSSRRELLERAWETARDKDVRLITQIFLRLAANGAQSSPAQLPFVDAVAPDWTEPLVTAGIAEGLTPERARTEAQLLHAAGLGLMLDELSGAPAQETERALQLILDMMCGPRRG